MPDESANQSATAESAEVSARGKSTIEYPYLDLDNSIEIVKTVHLVEHDRCEWNQLATKLGVASEGGGFRMRMLTAKTFGLLTYEKGQVTLTDLGIRAADSAYEKRARFDSFMYVALFKQLFDRLNGQPLPPVAAIERMIEGLGVAPKQKDKARQVFLRSAKQAGLFELSSDRLSIPPGLSGAPPRPSAAASPPPDTTSPPATGGGSGGGDDQHPFIRGLLQKLPPADAEWPLESRAKWLTTAANIFDLMYASPVGEDRTINVQIKSESL